MLPGLDEPSKLQYASGHNASHTVLCERLNREDMICRHEQWDLWSELISQGLTWTHKYVAYSHVGRRVAPWPLSAGKSSRHQDLTDLLAQILSTFQSSQRELYLALVPALQ